jgi:hypothetical protein
MTNKEQKIVYVGKLDLKKNQRHPSMKEAVEKNRVSYWGLYKIDQKLLKHVKENKQSREKNIKLMFATKRKLTALMKKKKETTAPKALEKINIQLKKLLPIFKKSLAQYDIDEKQRKQEIKNEEKKNKKDKKKKKNMD